MNLLHYEFTDAPQGSYNYELGQLVKHLRHYCSDVSLEEFKAALPCLHAMESKLQQMDAFIGLDKRAYIEEIIQELEEISKSEAKIFEEVDRAAKAIIGSLYGTDFLLNELAYELKNDRATRWLEFHGYKGQNKDRRVLDVIKQLFRSICLRHNLIFIDVSR